MKRMMLILTAEAFSLFCLIVCLSRQTDFTEGTGVFLLLAVILLTVVFVCQVLDIHKLHKGEQEILMARDYKSMKETSLWKETLYHERFDDIFQQEISMIEQKNEMEVYERQTAIAALQSQINPHFLYNTLESIRGQAILDGNQEIAVMLEELGNFFRYSISRRENVVMLLEEIGNIRGYMFIQNYRFGGRYKLEIEYLCDESVNHCMVPKLMLQPIVENAILHAFQTQNSGTILVSIDMDDDYLMITVSDDGSGMSEEKLAELNAGMEGKRKTEGKHNGIALENVNRRIRVLFGEQYGLHAYSTEGHGTDIEIFLPVSMNGQDEGNYERNSV